MVRRIAEISWPAALAAIFGLALAFGASRAEAAPVKVACVGEHTTHSHAFPPTNRETQPVGMQEYPAMLQTLLGSGYDVRNFGDCCGTVIQGYSTVGQEVHPFVQGTNAGDGPGYNESIAFLPDVVIIGSWGRHDWGLDKPSTLTWDITKFQQGYDDLVQRYMKLSSHPKIFASLPIPILNGQDGPDNGVMTSPQVAVVRAVAAKYNLPIIDLYSAFLGHKELFKQPPDSEGEGEHVTDTGLKLIANKVYAAMLGAADAGTDASSPPVDASAPRDASKGVDAARDASNPQPEAGNAGAGGSGGAGGTAGTAGGAGGEGGASSGAGGASVGSGGAGGAAGGSSAGGQAGVGSTGAGTAGATSGGGTTTAGSSGTGTAGGPSSGNGCSCRSAGRTSSSSAWLITTAALAFAVSRRRKAG